MHHEYLHALRNDFEERLIGIEEARVIRKMLP